MHADAGRVMDGAQDRRRRRHQGRFANAFGAVATAMALTGSSLSLMPIVLFAQIRGDVLQNPHLGYAIAFAMIAGTRVFNRSFSRTPAVSYSSSVSICGEAASLSALSA